MLEEALQQFQVYACFQSSGIRALEVNSDQPRGWMKMGRVARQESETGAHQMGDSCRPTMSTLTTVLCNGYGSPDSKTPLVGRSLSQSKFVLRPRPLSPLGRTNARGRARLPPRSGLPPHHHLVFSSRLMHDETPIRTTSLLSLSVSSCIYAVLATIYTLGNLCISVLRCQSLSRYRLFRSPPPRTAFPSNMTVQQAEEFLWSNFSLSNHRSPIAWDPILSRAFPRLMHPSRIIPYYYRATGNFENDDITATTLISSDRFPVFRHLVQRYKGVLPPAICPICRSSTST
jgi:hypothetical protein